MAGIQKGIYDHNYASANQADFETQKEIVAGDALAMFSSWVITPAHNVEIRDDYHPDTRDPISEIPLEIGPHEVTGETYLLGGAAQGTAPDIDTVLGTAFTKDATAATTISAAGPPTTTSGTLTSDNVDAGQIMKLAVKDATGIVVENTTVLVTDKTGVVLTWWPPLENTPDTSNLTIVKSVVNYELSNENTNAITIHTGSADYGVTGVGTVFSNFVFKFARGAPCMLEMNGFCRDIKRMFACNFDGDFSAVDTTLVVDDTTIEDGAIGQLPLGEHVEFNTTSDRLTYTACVRDWPDEIAGEDPAVDAAITSYDLTDVTTGVPIRGLRGGITVGSDYATGDTWKMPQDAEATVTIDEKTELIGWFGDGGKVKQKCNPENRENAVEIVAYLEETTASAIITAAEAGAMKVMIQAGETDAKTFSIAMHNVNFEVSANEDAKGDKKKVTFTSRSVKYDDTNSLNSTVFGY